MTNTDDDLGGLVADQGAPPLEDPIEEVERPRYDARTALVVVDVQNDFAHPDGSLYVEGGPDVVSAANTEIAAAREAGALVVYSQDWHPPSTPHFVTEGGKWPPHCVRDTWGAEFHDELVVDGPTIRKGTGGEDGYSAFTMADPSTGETSSTGLKEPLEEHEIERVVVVGLALDVCQGHRASTPSRAASPPRWSPGPARPWWPPTVNAPWPPRAHRRRRRLTAPRLWGVGTTFAQGALGSPVSGPLRLWGSGDDVCFGALWAPASGVSAARWSAARPRIRSTAISMTTRSSRSWLAVALGIPQPPRRCGRDRR
ncbi:MAG: isochorismatase family protein [Microthrixaceae bacterium]